MAYPEVKGNSYGRFGFGISKGDGRHAPYIIELIGDNGQVTRLRLNEPQGLQLLADLNEFASQVLRQTVEDALFSRQYH